MSELPIPPDSEVLTPGAWQRMLAVLRIRRFTAFTVSQAVSNFGDKLDYMALLAMIAALAARNNWEVGRVNSFLLVIATLPAILFGPLAGVLVDRWDRRKVMLVCDSIRAGLVLLIPTVAMGTRSLTLVLAIAFLVFLLGMFFNTAKLAVIPNLVESRNLLEANSITSIIGRVATFLGMLLGGLIVDWPHWRRLGIQETWAAGFYVDGLTFVISAVTLALITVQLGVRAARPAGPVPTVSSRWLSLYQTLARRVETVVHDFAEAYRFMRASPPVRLVLFSIVQFVLLGAAVIVLLVPIIQTARDDLGLGVGTRGVGFVGAAGSVGLVLSSLGYGLVGRRLRKRTVLLGSFLVLGLLTIAIALSESLALTLGLAFLAGVLLGPVYIAQDTLLHETVPEATRGRVFSTREWFLNLTAALAAFLIGQILALVPQLTARVPFGIMLDDRRLLLLAVGVLTILLSAGAFLGTRRQAIG
jgi:MFS family permease